MKFSIYLNRHVFIMLFSPENRIRHFMQTVSNGDSLHEMLNPVSGKNGDSLHEMSNPVSGKNGDNSHEIYFSRLSAENFNHSAEC